MSRIKQFSRFAPILSLAGGLVTVFLIRRGVNFAPISTALALGAWASALLLSRKLRPAAAEDEASTKMDAAIRLASRTLVVGLYQNVLFFLVPIWFSSATLFSANMIYPILCAALALFSCFDELFAVHVLAHPVRRNAVSAWILFSVAVPALVVTARLPIRTAAGTVAFASVLFAAIIQGVSTRRYRSLFVGLPIAAAVAGFVYLVAPYLPPTPVQCPQAVAATQVIHRIPEGIGTTLPSGIPRAFAHFSVVAPDRFVQEIRFQWYVDGAARGRPIPSKIVGGRKKGFRTWTYLSNPKPGRYRVDLLTRDNQLIGRVAFRVK